MDRMGKHPSTILQLQEGTSNDREVAHSFLKMVPQRVFDRQTITTFNFGFVSLRDQRGELQSEVEKEI